MDSDSNYSNLLDQIPPDVMKQIEKEFETKDEVPIVMTITAPDGTQQQQQIILKKATSEEQEAARTGIPLQGGFKPRAGASATLTVTKPDGSKEEFS